MRLLKLIPLVSILFVLVAAGCTRGKTDTGSLTFSLPQRTAKVKSAGAKLTPLSSPSAADADDPQLGHVVINITGDGISAPILKTWDSHDSGPLTGPFTVPDVPSGSGRLIQVLAVYQTPVSQTMTIYYGDVSSEISSSSNSPDVLVTSVSGTQTSVNGNIFGRYFTTADGGPTADLNIKYQPPTGKPAMIIQRETMFNGWFTIFALSNASFIYELEPNALHPTTEVMFGGAVNLHSSVFDPNENSGAEWYRRTAAFIPYHLRGENQNGGTMTWSAESAQIYVWGFWGNDAAKASTTWNTRVVCRDNLSGSLTSLTKYTSNVANQATQPGLTVSNIINIGLSVPTDAQLLDQSGGTPSGFITFDGGDTTCPPSGHTVANQYTDWFRVAKVMVDGHGSDGAAGFSGPFKIDASLNPISVTPSDPRVVNADVLPGVIAVVDEVRLFKKINIGTSEFHIDNPDCTSLDPSLGLVLDGSATLNAAGHMTMTTHISAAEALTGVGGVLCAYRNGVPYAAGISLDPHYFNQGGGSTATKLAIKFLNDQSTSPQIYNNVCVPLVVQPEDANGNPAFLAGGQLTNTAPSASDYFSSQPDCSNPMTGTAITSSMGTQTGGMLLYYKSVRSGSNPVTLSLTASGVTTATFAFGTSDGSNSATYMRLTDTPAAVKAFACYPIDMFTADASGATSADTYSGSSFINLSSNGPVVFYNDGQCTQVAASTPFGGSAGAQITNHSLYFSYQSLTVAPFNITMTPQSPITSGDTLSYAAGQISTPGDGAAFQLNVMNQMAAGGCYALNIQLVDANHNLTPMLPSFNGGTSANVTLDSGGLGEFHQSYDTNCLSTPSSSATFTEDSVHTSMLVYFKPLTAGSGAITATASGGTGTPSSYTGSAQISVTPEVATLVYYAFPGQTWTDGSSYPSGSPDPIFIGQTVTVDVYAVLASNHMRDTSFVTPAGHGLILNSVPFTVAEGLAPFGTGDAGHKQIHLTFTGGPQSFGFGMSSNFTDQFGGLQISTSAQSMYYLNIIGSPPIAQQAAVYTGSLTAVYTGNCTPVSIQAATNMASGSGHTYTAGVPLTSALDGQAEIGSNVLYTDAGCTTPLTTQNIIPASDSEGIIYAQPAGTSGYTGVLQNNLFGNIQVNITGTATTPGAHAMYQILGPTGTFSGICQPFVVAAYDGVYQSVPITETVNFSLVNQVNGATGSFYLDAQCTSPTSSVSFAGERAKKFYFMPSSPSHYGAVQINAIDSGSTHTGSTFLDILHYQ